jgi:hypothetical protein
VVAVIVVRVVLAFLQISLRIAPGEGGGGGFEGEKRGGGTIFEDSGGIDGMERICTQESRVQE